MGRHGCRAAFAAALCALTAALFAQPAVAAEELGDAGELPLTAQELGPSGPLGSITGNVGTFDSDMYRICLTSGSEFWASTVDTTGFDTQLFLFDEQGMGVYANDDDFDSDSKQSTLPAGHEHSPRTPGVYYLAISALDRDPQSAADPRFPFIFLPSAGVVGLDRGGGGPVTGWAHRRDALPGGAYTITLSPGTRSCVDDTPPTVTLTTPPDGAAYAQNQDVRAEYTCADDEPDASGLAACDGDVPSGQAIDTSELGTHDFTVTARDRRGNVTTVTHSYTVEDRTAPVANLRTPGDGDTYPRHQQVTADYDCTDEIGGSGIASCTGDVPDGAPIDTSVVGSHSFTVTATDGAGNTTVETHTYRVVDVTAPMVHLRTPPVVGAVYHQGAQVPADYDCTDEAGGSGVESCTGDVPDGAPIDTATLGLHTFTVVAVDGDGNRTEVGTAYRVLDRTAPSIAVHTPSEGAIYSLGEVVAADYDCTDPGGSGVAVCAGNEPDGAPIDTSSVGEHTFIVQAVDVAGNAANRRVTYRVEERFSFDFEGFFWPIKNRPRVNWVRAGALVPIRFSLDGWQGREVIADGYPRSREVECGSSAEVDGGEPTRSAGRWRLRYNQRRDLYVYLWKTDRDWAGECRQFILKLADGSYHRADFRFLRKRHHWHDIWDD